LPQAEGGLGQIDNDALRPEFFVLMARKAGARLLLLT
jgi:hypothetical protein